MVGRKASLMCGPLFAVLGHPRISLTLVRSTDTLGGAGDMKIVSKLVVQRLPSERLMAGSLLYT